MTELRAVLAYLRKEWRLELTYRFSVLFSVLGLFTSIATYFFIDRLFGRQIAPELAPFGATYFAYALVGNAFMAYVGTAIGGLSGRIGAEQSRGTLEILLGTPTRLGVLVLAIAVWTTLYATAEVFVFFLVGGVGFGVDFGRVGWPAFVSAAALAVLLFNGLGLLEAGCLVLFQRGAVAAWALNGLAALVGGVFFPVAVLPGWLQALAELNPITHAVRALQLAIFQGASIGALHRELAALAVFAALLVPLSLGVWRWALRRARLEGSLGLH
jgi:ABC-2 type transport system permease protein